jgi:hypothetical protein
VKKPYRSSSSSSSRVIKLKSIQTLRMAAAVFTLAACSKDQTSVVIPRAANVAAVSGDGQSGVVGTALTGVAVVKVLDASGNPLPGVTVSFTTPDLLAIAYPVNAISGVDGTASTRWTLGGKKGKQILRATVAGVTDTIVFNANALPGQPVTMQIVSGDNQSATAGSTLPAPLKVLLTDAFLNHVDGVTVTYGGTDNTRSTTAPSAVSDTSGIAATSWKLKATGLQTLTAHVFPTPLEATFYATGMSQ